MRHITGFIPVKMKKIFRLTIVLVILSLLVPWPANTIARPLQLITTSILSPTSCPPGGCAAGQRLNARAEFPVIPLFTTDANTQVCVYTSQEGSNNWADASVFNISNPSVYTIGELNSICSTNLPPGSIYLGGANAAFTSSSNQQFDFAFRIDKQSTTTGSLWISVYPA